METFFKQSSKPIKTDRKLTKKAHIVDFSFETIKKLQKYYQKQGTRTYVQKIKVTKSNFDRRYNLLSNHNLQKLLVALQDWCCVNCLKLKCSVIP